MKKSFVSFINFLGKLIKKNGHNTTTPDKKTDTHENIKIDETIKVHENTKSEIDLKSIWTKIYKNWFDKEVDFSNLVIPEIYDSERHFAIIVTEGMTIGEVARAMRNKFEIYFFDNLEYVPTADDRIANKDYIVIFKKNIKADSNNDPDEINLNKQTIIERLLLEIFYFDATGEHPEIDAKSCNGSWRGVRWISANWNGNAFFVSLKTSSGMDGDCWH